jgi:hypothetical protein
MSPLLKDDGEPFTTGRAPIWLRHAVAGDRMTRLFLELTVAGVSTEGVVDTGGTYLILDPDLARRIGLQHEHAIGRERIVIRGLVCNGTIHRLPVSFLAAAGESLDFEATAFLPIMAPHEDWMLPTYLGWQGCLERIRFAVDPGEELIYFGALS